MEGGVTPTCLAGPSGGADHAAEIPGSEGGILVGENVGLDVAEGRIGLVVDAVVEALDDLFLEVAGARVCADDGCALGLREVGKSDAERNAVVQAHPRSNHFKEDIIQAFYDGIKRKPDTTFGNVKADVLADKDPAFRRGNFCSVIRGSAWRG